MAKAVAGRHPQQDVDKGRVDPARVRRYWPGRAPEWAQEEDEEALLNNRDQVAAPVVVSKADPRLQRLTQQQKQQEDEMEEPEHRRVRRKLEEVGVKEEVGEDLEPVIEGALEAIKDEDEEELLGRRAALRQR